MDDNARSAIIGIAVLIVGVVCLALSITNIVTESFQYLGIFGVVGTVLGLLITIPSVKSIKHG
ncbi:MAG: hypothetical protein HY222_03295 [Thaumarchaeota archaeon]|nr:hypothetical protein [Nitrososphaerota archaeon]MBI3641400.1 hypothetical protein [Nitrososphaerota archaeon]